MIEIKIDGGKVHANFDGNTFDILKNCTYALHVMAKAVSRSLGIKLNDALDVIYSSTATNLEQLEKAEGTEIAIPTDIKGDKK